MFEKGLYIDGLRKQIALCCTHILCMEAKKRYVAKHGNNDFNLIWHSHMSVIYKLAYLSVMLQTNISPVK
jgi:hypothetical protein